MKHKTQNARSSGMTNSSRPTKKFIDYKFAGGEILDSIRLELGTAASLPYLTVSKRWIA